MLELIIRWIFFALALLFVAWVVPGISLAGFFPALWAALVIGIVNIVIRPVLFLLTLPINILTLGLFTFVLNGLLFWFVGNIVPGFMVSGFWAAFFGSILLSIISISINRLEF